jgi:Fic family protein
MSVMSKDLAPIQITPLLPESERRRLSELPLQIFEALGELKAHVSPAFRVRVAKMVRAINAHYTNLIEGQPTFPHDIEVSPHGRPPASEAEARRRRIGIAHDETEQWMFARLESEPKLEIWSQRFICELHQALYERLDEVDRWLYDEHGNKTRPLLVGRIRESNAKVGHHIAPRHEELPRLLEQLFSIYRAENILPHRQVVAAAAAHHRLGFVHPFGDGNGRIMRLHSQACLFQAGLHAHGLWSLSRGLARNRSRYYEHLHAADQERGSDFDGRGPLSDTALARFCVFFLETALDQVRFMAQILDFRNLAPRVEAYARETNVFARAHVQRGSALLKELVVRGQLTRAEAAFIMDRKEGISRQIIQAAIHAGLVETENQKAPLMLKLSSNLHEAYFPRLYDTSMVNFAGTPP